MNPAYGERTAPPPSGPAALLAPPCTDAVEDVFNRFDDLGMLLTPQQRVLVADSHRAGTLPALIALVQQTRGTTGPARAAQELPSAIRVRRHLEDARVSGAGGPFPATTRPVAAELWRHTEYPGSFFCRVCRTAYGSYSPDRLESVATFHVTTCGGPL
ncbi:hypothetical protein ACFVWN_20545 [Nocardiopsis flavescens]|uniref:hypothetical protein n=1 Tax=Nocardiopsis flavescens TaxID=758803 RepID=UPI00366854DD